MIERNIVHEKDRLAFLPRHCGRLFLEYEQYVYSMARRLCPEYDGGFWNYYELSNHGWYMGLDADRTFHVVWDGNYYEGEMSADAFSIVACLYAYSIMFNSQKGELFVPAYYALREYAAEHAEAKDILAAID